MKMPEGHYLLYQPKYRTACVFDLHPRGMFNSRPPLLDAYGYRLLIDPDRRVQLQAAWLAERDAVDPQTNRRYPWVLEEARVPLDADLALDPAALADAGCDRDTCSQIGRDHLKWREGFVPGAAEGKVDREALAGKLDAALRDAEEARRRMLVDKNKRWIEAALPRLVFDFRHGLYRKVHDRLLPDYRDRGGQANEDELIRRMMAFYRVCEHEGDDRLAKPDGRFWNSEDEIEACWIGLAGSPEEAKRVVETMQAVILPLAANAFE
jgi:hypothetical protein